MITATAASATLTRRLTVRAAHLAQRHGAALASAQARRRTDWHSARSLWPDFAGD